MSPYAELHADGQLGEAGYNLLFVLARQELRRFPVLQVATADDDAVWDVVGDFLVERGRGVTTMLLANASDDDSLGALLRTSLRHWLIDEVRKTDRGALRRRLERLISEDERFEVVPRGQAGAGRWRLAGTAGPPAGPPLADLCAAARSVRDVRIPPWSSEERRAPAADGESLGRIMLAVLTEAVGVWSQPLWWLCSLTGFRMPSIQLKSLWTTTKLLAWLLAAKQKIRRRRSSGRKPTGTRFGSRETCSRICQQRSGGCCRTWTARSATR